MYGTVDCYNHMVDFANLEAAENQGIFSVWLFFAPSPILWGSLCFAINVNGI